MCGDGDTEELYSMSASDAKANPAQHAPRTYMEKNKFCKNDVGSDRKEIPCKKYLQQQRNIGPSFRLAQRGVF